MNQNTEQSRPTKVKRRRYDEQFKRDALALLEGGRGTTQLARELGVSQWNLRDWKLLFGTGGAAASRQVRSVRQGARGLLLLSLWPSNSPICAGSSLRSVARAPF